MRHSASIINSDIFIIFLYNWHAITVRFSMQTYVSSKILICLNAKNAFGFTKTLWLLTNKVWLCRTNESYYLIHMSIRKLSLEFCFYQSGVPAPWYKWHSVLQANTIQLMLWYYPNCRYTYFHMSIMRIVWLSWRAQTNSAIWLVCDRG